MKERPIIFSGESVRAILADQKTQTRRIVKPQPPAVGGASAVFRYADGWRFGGVDYRDDSRLERCPHGVAGDRLWVREKWAVRRLRAGFWLEFPDGKNYHATRPDAERYAKGDGWRSPIHMPRWASRLTLELVSVRVERLQDISEEDAKAEGIAEPAPVHGRWCDPKRGREGHWSYRKPFSRAWDAIHSAGAWEANPWVWRVEFRRAET